MSPKRVLVANRGEIAIRIMSAISDCGMQSVAIYSEDDENSLHLRKADDSIKLQGKGAAAYLNIKNIIKAAKSAECDAIHPGYGFLSENAEFARTCADNHILFIGPTPEQLELFGNKTSAKSLASQCDVPLIAGTLEDTSLDQVRAFMDSLDGGTPVVIKAIMGGGGRGMRVVSSPGDLEKSWQRCRSEAKLAFGDDRVYVEQLIPKAKHVEIQILGDGTGEVSHLWERECSAQRQHQKLIEIAPSPGLNEKTRDALIEAAIRMAKKASYLSLGTFEFLIDAENDSSFFFIEANPRLQVEHTVTEAVTGIDLVQTQLRIAAGETLSSLNLSNSKVNPPVGYAIQTRINMETLSAKGKFKPSGGKLEIFEPPSGPGIRVDTFAYAGYQTSTRFDSLLAKLIVHSKSSNYGDAVRKTERSLREFRIEGFETNVPFLQALVSQPAFSENKIHTNYVDENLPELSTTSSRQKLYIATQYNRQDDAKKHGMAGIKIDDSDPLAILNHGKTEAREKVREVIENSETPDNSLPVLSPMQGTIIEISVKEGDSVHKGSQLLIMEAMKMEHVIQAPASGLIKQLNIEEGDAIVESFSLLYIEEQEVEGQTTDSVQAIDPDHIRPDLAEAIERHQFGLDENRPEAVAKRRKTRHRTARENIQDLCDEGSFKEYGPLMIAAQRRRRSLDDLIRNTPADGMVAGIGSVNGAHFKGREAQCVLMSYDYTVLAGTQGGQNHRKKDRMFEIAKKQKLPVIFFTEGGGGRPGDTDGIGVAGLDCLAFQYFGQLSGLVPLIGITTGRCFAGNAALLGCCDLIIATEGSNIGMGGPAMIEGGGLGIFKPEEVGPMDVQVANGVVDIAVKDEKEAVAVAKKYLSYFQGPVSDWNCEDQRLLRSVIPENRLRIYDVRDVINLMADSGSVLEIREQFGLGMITAFVRIEGRPTGVIANNPKYLSGAIDSVAADKASRFMQLCDAYDIPLLFLCDTPGIMVGPEVEKTALVRHAARMFVTAASLTIPFFTIVLRKGYGLGAQAMAGGSFKAPLFTVTWPTGEFGGMGLEGAVKLGYRKELAAMEDPDERVKLYENMVEKMYERGKAVNTASTFELDDVIDPMDSREWIMTALKSAPQTAPREGKKRPCVDTW